MKTKELIDYNNSKKKEKKEQPKQVQVPPNTNMLLVSVTWNPPLSVMNPHGKANWKGKSWWKRVTKSHLRLTCIE